MIMINFYDSANIDFNNLKAFLDKDLKNIILYRCKYRLFLIQFNHRSSERFVIF